MKSVFKIIGVFALVAFVAGCFVSVFYMFFIMPEQLLEQLNLRGEENMATVRTAILPTIFILIGELVLGFLIIGFLATNSKQQEANIIYVERRIEASKDDSKEAEILSKERNYTERLEEIRTKIEQKKSNAEKRQVAISELCLTINASIGGLFHKIINHEQRFLELVNTFAYHLPDSQRHILEFGEGVAGQVAKEGKKMILNQVPAGYLQIMSGLGSVEPTYVLVQPIMENQDVIGVLEVGSLYSFEQPEERFIEEISQLIRPFLA